MRSQRQLASPWGRPRSGSWSPRAQRDHGRERSHWHDRVKRRSSYGPIPARLSAQRSPAMGKSRATGPAGRPRSFCKLHSYDQLPNLPGKLRQSRKVRIAAVHRFELTKIKVSPRELILGVIQTICSSLYGHRFLPVCADEACPGLEAYRSGAARKSLRQAFEQKK